MLARVLLLAVALLLTTIGGRADPITDNVVLVGTNAASIYNTPQLILDSGSYNRNWAEVVNNSDTLSIIVDDKLPVWKTNTVGAISYTNWTGTILMPGGSYLIRPFGTQGVNAGTWKVYGVVVGVGAAPVGTREIRR